MDSVTRAHDRRRGSRAGPEGEGWRADAVLRPGLAVRVVNIGTFGALVECQARLRPGRSAELQLMNHQDRKLIVSGRVERCHVVRLEPLCFQGAIAFDGSLARASE